MPWTERRKRFRAILTGSRCMFPASVFDPISARIAGDLGFEAGILGGSVASLTVLGAPDLVVLTQTELAEQCRRMCRASDLPLLVDADHGFGNALNVRRTVEELEMAGAAALTIEDTLLPTPFGGKDLPALISIEEAAGKMRAAVSGRRDPDLVVVARTKLLSGGLEDMLTRVETYERCGVDAIFVSGLKTRPHLDALAAVGKLPLILGRMSPELSDPEYLSGRGVKLALQGHKPFLAAVQAIHDTLSALRDTSRAADAPRTASDEYMRRITAEEEYIRLEKDTLGGGR